jgi:hypothetical protein
MLPMHTTRIAIAALFIISVSFWFTRPNVVLFVSFGAMTAVLCWRYASRSRLSERPLAPPESMTADMATIDLALEYERADMLRAEIEPTSMLEPEARKNAICQALSSAQGITHVAVRNWPEHDFEVGMHSYQEIRKEIYARCGIEPPPESGFGYRGDAETAKRREPRFVLVTLTLLAKVEIREPLGTQFEAVHEMLARIANMKMDDIMRFDFDFLPLGARRGME